RAPNGELFIGVFASYDIPANTELTYDYNFSTFGGAEEQECLCGALTCRGVMGVKTKFKRSESPKPQKKRKAIKKKVVVSDLENSTSECVVPEQDAQT
ncbi:11938_t:CDS:2, partial [Acaulospora morrowiae]